MNRKYALFFCIHSIAELSRVLSPSSSCQIPKIRVYFLSSERWGQFYWANLWRWKPRMRSLSRTAWLSSQRKLPSPDSFSVPSHLRFLARSKSWPCCHTRRERSSLCAAEAFDSFVCARLLWLQEQLVVAESNQCFHLWWWRRTSSCFLYL